MMNTDAGAPPMLPKKLQTPARSHMLPKKLQPRRAAHADKILLFPEFCHRIYIK